MRLLVLVGVLAAVLLVVSGAHAQATRVIDGVVADVTRDARVPQATVALRTLKGDQLVDQQTTVTDANGRFHFEGLPSSQDLQYVLGTTYLNVEYTFGPFDLARQPDPVSLLVYQTTSSDADISILRASAAVPSVDAETGLIQVLEVVTYTNRGKSTFVGDLFANPQKGGVLRVPLPPDALDVSLGSGFGSEQPLATNEGMLTRAPVPPGQVVLVYAYKLPFTGSAYIIERSFAYPVDRVSFLIGTDLPRPSSDDLTTVETVNVNGKQNFSLSASGVKAGEPVRVTLSGLPPLAPPKSASQGIKLDTALRGAVIGVMAMAVVLVVAYARGGKRRPAVATTAVAEIGALRQERQALVSALAEMDISFQEGHVARDDYKKRRRSAKQRLVDVTLLIQEKRGT